MAIGVSGSFTPSGSGHALLTLNTAKNAHTGTFTLTFVGASGSLHQSAGLKSHEPLEIGRTDGLSGIHPMARWSQL